MELTILEATGTVGAVTSYLKSRPRQALGGEHHGEPMSRILFCRSGGRSRLP